ncbi:MAG: OFA family MFS transporter [Saprospiraceae bacterium]|nr:OFA family MFS transporter [Saprospiraceae bacterium]
MNRNLVVVGAILVQLALGAIYAWSVFTPSLAEAGWSKGDTQWVFSVGLAAFALSMVFAGSKLDAWGPQRLTIIGGSLLGLGYFLTGILGATNFWVVVLFIGVMAGAGIGFAYVVPIAVGIQWFPDKRGWITGLAVAGFGFGALLWVKLAGSWGHLIANLGLSTTFMVYGLLFTVMVILGSLWLRFPPKGWKPNGYSASHRLAEVALTRDYTPREMLTKVQFYLIFFTFVFSASAGLMSIGLMKLYPMEALQNNGMDSVRASAVAGTAMAIFFALANGLGRIIWGIISDEIGRKKSIILMTLIQGVMVLLFTRMAGTEMLLYLGAAVIGFNFGGNFALFPTITADIFGSKTVGQDYPFVFLAYGVGGVLGPLLGGFLGDAGNFPLAFTILGMTVLIGTVLMILVKPIKLEVEIVSQRRIQMHGDRKRRA